MPCYGPLPAYRSKEIGVSGKRGITVRRNASFSAVALQVPCGQCIGCRLEHARQWAVRCMHEKSLYSQSSFLTLTYDDEWLPEGGTLVKRHLQLFMKRLRKKYGVGLRFYASGEYGETTARAHYHVLLFNLDFADKKLYKRNGRGEPLYTSESLSSIWTYGRSLIGGVTFESCCYVAGYVVDKVTGERADRFYSRVTSDGVCYELVRPFSVMSRRPGIGTAWYEKYGAHAYEFDSVVIRGREVRPPRFYDGLHERVDKLGLARIKSKRKRRAIRKKSDNGSRRRRVKERIVLSKLAQRRKEI